MVAELVVGCAVAGCVLLRCQPLVIAAGACGDLAGEELVQGCCAVCGWGEAERDGERL